MRSCVDDTCQTKRKSNLRRVVNSHELKEAIIAESDTGEHLEGRRCDTTLVGRRVTEEHDTLLLQLQTSTLGDEQVGCPRIPELELCNEMTRNQHRLLTTLDKVLEVWHAISIPKLRDVVDVDRLGTCKPNL